MKALLLMALLAAAAAAQEKVDLRPVYAEGDRYEVKSTMSLSLKGKDASLEHKREKSYRETVVKAVDGVPSKVKRTYDVHRVTHGEVGEEETRSLVAVGKELVLVRKGDEVVDEADELDEDDDLVLGSPLDLFLPGEAVAAGASWNVPKERLERFIGDEIAEATCTATLTEVTERDGRKVARITVKMTIGGPQRRIEATIEGEEIFDLTLKKPTSLTLKGPTKLHDPEAPAMKLEGPFAYHATVARIPAR